MALLREPIADVTPGLYLGTPPLMVPNQGLIDCLNVRVKQRSIEHGNMGWSPFPDDSNAVNLDGKPVMLIERFVTRSGSINTVFANTTDLFQYNPNNSEVVYLTPREETGTVDVTNGSTTVSGTGTSWSTTLKAGDFIAVGATGETSLGATWYEIASITSDTELELTETYNETTSTGEDYTARSVFTGDETNVFSTEVFFNAADLTTGSDGDRWYATNGIDNVVAWDGTSDQAYVPDLGNVDTCRYLKRFSNIMFYISPTISGDQRGDSVRTSAIGKPEETVSDEAAEFIVQDSNDNLVAAAEIGDLLALYGENSITLAQFVGDPLQFVFRGAAADTGPISSRALALFPDAHYYIGRDGQYVFDGTRAATVNDHVWRDVRRRTPPEREYQTIAAFDEEQGDLFWVTPLTTDSDQDGAPEVALVQHYLEDTGQQRPEAFTRREMPVTAIGDFERETSITWDQLTQQWSEYNFRWNDKFFEAGFPQKLIGTRSGDVFILGESNEKNGTAMTSFARFSRVSLGSVEQSTVVRRVYPFIEETPGGELQVTVYGAEAPHAKASQRAQLTFEMDLPDANRFVSPRQAMRYMEVRFDGVDGAFWRLSGYTVDAVPGARR